MDRKAIPPRPASSKSPASKPASSRAPATKAPASKAPASKGRALGRPVGRFTQHRRLDRMRALLEQSPKGLSLYELADALSITPRSMRRYLREVTAELGLESLPTRAGGAHLWRIRPGEQPRKVGLRRTQAYAILAARKLFEPLRGSALFDEIDEAARNVLTLATRPGRGPNAGIADARLEDRFLYLPVAPKDYAKKTEELDDLFQAVADLRPLRCRYASVGHAAADEPIVIHPYAMVLYKDAIYCVGLHTGRGEIRTFLVDRMRDTEVEYVERFALPDGFRVDDYFQGSFGIWRGTRKIRVVIEFDAEAAEWLRNRRIHPTQRVVATAGGGMRITMTVGDLRELSGWLLGHGPRARALEPPELVDLMRTELAASLARYDEPTPASVRRG